MPKITKIAIDKAPIPETGDNWLWDSDLEGFGVRIQASGRKVYVIRYRAKDAKRTQRKMTIARCSDVDTFKARELARKEFAKIAEGRDPVAERKPIPTAPRTASVEVMFEGYVASMRAKNRTSAAEVERVLLRAELNAADALGRTKAAADVTAQDVANYLSLFFQRGHRSAADKARSYIASAYAWALKAAHDYTATDRVDFSLLRNPVDDVAKDAGSRNTRDRNLSGPDLHLLWGACDHFSQGVASCIRLLIGCGQRVQETLRIDGADIDLATATWRMPAHKTKGRKAAHSIPLPAQVLPVLKSLIDQHGDGPLFPSGSDLIKHGAVNQTIANWLDGQTEVEHFQTRDLRRTWKSRTHDAGVDRFTRDLIQQHSQNGDTGGKHYDRADYFDMMRAGMNKWEAYLGTVLSGSVKSAG